MKRLIMIDANTFWMPIAGVIILGMVSILGFFGKRWLKEFESLNRKILSSLESLKNQVTDLKTESQLQTATIREMETRIEFKFQGVERQLEVKRQKIEKIMERLMAIEKSLDRLKLFHTRNHPTDNL